LIYDERGRKEKVKEEERNKEEEKRAKQ